jgi:hypothetical protein
MLGPPPHTTGYIDASEAMMEITAGREALEHLRFDGAANEFGNIEFTSMSSNALIQRTCPRVARAITIYFSHAALHLTINNEQI